MKGQIWSIIDMEGDKDAKKQNIYCCIIKRRKFLSFSFCFRSSGWSLHRLSKQYTLLEYAEGPHLALSQFYHFEIPLQVHRHINTIVTMWVAKETVFKRLNVRPDNNLTAVK